MSKTKNAAGLKRAEQSFDHDVRIESVVDLASLYNSIQDSSRLPEQIERVFDDSFDSRHLHPSIADLMKSLGIGEDDDNDVVLEKLQEASPSQCGLIFMQGATPSRNYHGTSFTSGWGCYYTGWVVAETFDACWDLLVTWADEMHAKDEAKGSTS